MSQSDYKNINEGYLKNTGYNGNEIRYTRERYGGCGSEPTPYMMNEGYLKNTGNEIPYTREKYQSLPSTYDYNKNWAKYKAPPFNYLPNHLASLQAGKCATFPEAPLLSTLPDVLRTRKDGTKFIEPTDGTKCSIDPIYIHEKNLNKGYQMTSQNYPLDNTTCVDYYLSVPKSGKNIPNGWGKETCNSVTTIDGKNIYLPKCPIDYEYKYENEIWYCSKKPTTPKPPKPKVPAQISVLNTIDFYKDKKITILSDKINDIDNIDGFSVNTISNIIISSNKFVSFELLLFYVDKKSNELIKLNDVDLTITTDKIKEMRNKEGKIELYIIKIPFFTDVSKKKCKNSVVVNTDYWQCKNKTLEKCCPGSKTYWDYCPFYESPCK